MSRKAVGSEITEAIKNSDANKWLESVPMSRKATAKRKESAKLTFNKTTLAGLQPPASGRTYHHDAKTPGLCICITASGARTFYLYRWADGRPVRQRLGTVHELTVERARDLVRTLVSDLVQGVDVVARKRAAREEPTLGLLCDHWMIHAKQHKKSWPEDERLIKKHLGGLKPRRLSTVHRGDITALHAKLGDGHGKYLANRVLALLRAMFGKAIELGYQGIDPTAGVVKFKEESRDRYLTPQELPTFFTALKAYPDETLRDFFMVALLTGARRGNVQSMRWDDIDLDSAHWRIPDTKSGEPVLLPLSEAALTVLRGRHASKNGSPWVFPGHRHGTHLQEPKTAWKTICTSAGIADLRIHDLRRTLGSWQAIAGTSLPIIGKSLGHKSTAATSIYARLGIEPVRDSINLAGAALLAAGEPTKPTKGKSKRKGATNGKA